ncbi:MAG: thiamine-phosphate kinase [Candidatus Omnitrophica bacterium]|nr:thiamine-phosphate kinase [Candidatus Omnitrophota bacterium]
MRTVREVGEFGLIERMRRRVRTAPSVVVGIGDDAAVLRGPGAGQRLLFASDMVVEGVHFLRRRVPARWIGWKALACNVSDIAAMGGVPHWAVVSLGLPRATPVRFVDELYAGLARCARRYGVALVGGDTVRAPQVVVDVAILGTAERRRLTLRRGARVGDQLFVTGRLGGSYRSGRHARFLPRLAEAQALLRRVRVHAMMDLSDGLASDLWQMSRASRVTLRVEAARIPVARAGRTVYHALMDGEDFELLFAVGAREAARMPRRIGRCPVTRVGAAVRRGAGVELLRRDGRIAPLLPRGFRHF